MLDVFQLVAQRVDEELETIFFHMNSKPSPQRPRQLPTRELNWARFYGPSTEGFGPGHLVSNVPMSGTQPATYSTDETWE